MEISLAEILRRVGVEVLLVHRVSPQSSTAAEDGFPQWEVSTNQERNLMPSGQESDLDSGLYEGTYFFFRPSSDDYRRWCISCHCLAHQTSRIVGQSSHHLPDDPQPSCLLSYLLLLATCDWVKVLGYSKLLLVFRNPLQCGHSLSCH